ncbi:hypothetical protein EZV62_004808 [Acer yangbiense]|uniref:Protein kinase domain-containing protein n=1 Tax=Acer yangbiense TaxID=1000413 RepID=A0A5C7IKR7_9ROSI|nr:hypothetical protein EZV62_004808 [Acer yangbiense]
MWQALSKTLTIDELFYLKEQFAIMEPNKNRTISLDNVKAAIMKFVTDAMKESRIPDLLSLMTIVIAVEDVRREVKILRALSRHDNLVKFYDAYKDHDNIYVVMELCEGGELLDRILSRGGKYTEDDAKAVMIQILNVVSFCHLQGVVHRDLKPKMKDLMTLLVVRYVPPKVLHRSYSTKVDV